MTKNLFTMNNLKNELPLQAIEDEDVWVDVHDHQLMVSLGIHLPDYKGRDPKVWEKTSKEKELLKQMKGRCHTLLPRAWPFAPNRYPFYSKLIVRIRPSNKFKFKDIHGNEQKKTYFSHKNVCVTDIPNILAKYYVWKDKARQSLVISYYWNGKTYSPRELPNVKWK